MSYIGIMSFMGNFQGLITHKYNLTDQEAGSLIGVNYLIGAAVAILFG
jgi:hypothetical protein